MSLKYRARFDGPAFRRARERKGLSATELAALIGVREGTIENWEAGGNPRADRLVAAAAVLRKDPNGFWIVRCEGDPDGYRGGGR